MRKVDGSLRLPAAVSVETEHLIDKRFVFVEPAPKFQWILAGRDEEMLRPRNCSWRWREEEEPFLFLGFVGFGFLQIEGLWREWKPIAISIAAITGNGDLANEAAMQA